jgi:type IV pilus assembly protein PilM
MEFFSIKPESFGLNLSDRSMKIAKLRERKRNFDLASFGTFSIEPGLIKNGEIKNEDRLAEIIKKSLKKIKGKKLNTKYVVASLPEQKAFLQVVQMPKMTEEELRSAIIFEAENYIPIPIEQAYLDFQVISLENLTEEILIIAFPKKLVDSYLSLFKKAGLQPLVFETESMAISRALVKNRENQASLALIDLGETKANFIIFSKNSIRFSSSIPIALEKKSLADLKEQISKYIDYYQSHNRGKKIEKVLLSGKANLKEFSVFLSKELKIPTELGSFPLSIEESLSYTTALGLALRGIIDLKN